MIEMIKLVFGIAMLGIITSVIVNVFLQLSEFKKDKYTTKTQYLKGVLLCFVPFYYYFKTVYDGYNELEN